MNKPQSDFGALSKLMSRELVLHSILECVKLNFFDYFDGGPVSVEQAAFRFGFEAEPAAALLEMFQAHGLLNRGPDGFENSAVSSEYLVSDSEFFQGSFLQVNNIFTQSIKENFIPLLKGECRLRDCSDSRWAEADMMLGTLQNARTGSLQDTVEFVSGLPGFQSMLFMGDIGGNHAEFSMSLLDLNPGLQGVVLDLPGVVGKIESRIVTRGYKDRLKAVACDMRTEVLKPDEFDLLLASHVLYAFMDDLSGFLDMLHSSLKKGGWFVAQHMNPDSYVDATEKKALEFLTRMSGYATHFISQAQLETAFAGAGFVNIQAAPAGRNGCGLILAGQRA